MLTGIFYCRDIPPIEQATMSEVLMGLYTCQFSKLPTEVTGHSFLISKTFIKWQPHLDGFSRCMKKNVDACKIESVCPPRVGLEPELQKQCLEALGNHRENRTIDWNLRLKLVDTTGGKSNITKYSSGKNSTGNSRRLLAVDMKPDIQRHGNVAMQTSVIRRKLLVATKSKARPSKDMAKGATRSSRAKRKTSAMSLSPNSTEGQKMIQSYVRCLGDVQRNVDSCLRTILPKCLESKLHAIKTVRLDMGSVEKLLENIPNLRVIHLLRDPRGVALSRRGVENNAGVSGKGSIVQTARMYCEVAAKDLKIRRRLEERFPGAITQVIYEDFTSDPIKLASDVYRFLNMTLPASVRKYLDERTQTKSSTKWQDRLSFHQAYDIHQHCTELFSLVQEPRWLTMW